MNQSELDERFARAIAAFDAANAEDPTQIVVDGVKRPRELVDAERLSAWVTRMDPSASEALRLAARCQHIRRWEIPRKSYADGRIGYLEWRKDLSKFHAKTAGELLRSAGYDDETIARVERINRKTSIKADAEVQAMEDALCLAFLEHELDEFAAKHPDHKIIDIIQKTWRKMSDRGHEAALKLPLAGRAGALVQQALSG